MSKKFNSIAIVGKFMRQSDLTVMRDDLKDLAQHLSNKNIEVWLEEKTAKHAKLSGFKTSPLEQIGRSIDLVIVMGGDGTMLSVGRALKNYKVPLVGINRGRFGFLTDLRAEKMLEQIDKILDGDYLNEARMMLTSEVTRNGEQIHQDCAMNDVVIKSDLRLIELEVKIDNEFVQKQRSDGLIISTPTGTTAYSLSAGGPILHPSLQAIALVPICPHTLSNRPIAVSNSVTIEVTIVGVEQAQVSFDGQYQLQLKEGDRISIERADDNVILLHPSNHSYFDMLRNKLHWG